MAIVRTKPNIQFLDRHRCGADPDPDPTFHFNIDPDPNPTLCFAQIGKSGLFFNCISASRNHWQFLGTTSHNVDAPMHYET
jgi:hypothetical protein